MTPSASPEDHLRPRITRSQLIKQINDTLFYVNSRMIARWPVPYRIVGRCAMYDEAEAMEHARQLLRDARVQRAEPRQLACQRVLDALTRRATQS